MEAREYSPVSPSFDDPGQKRAAFEAEALPFLRPLYGAASRLASDSDEAADLVQETWLRAYRTFESYRPGTNCRAWLFTILYSVFSNQLAKRRREEGPFTAEELERRYQVYVEMPVGTDDELSPEVGAALNALPEIFRLAVTLVDLEEFSHDEAARVLDCPVATLRTRLFRGRRMLLVVLREHARRTGFLRAAD